MSEFAGKLGQKVASEKVTAIDDGTIPGAWGSVNIDDEGTPNRRRVLIEKGVLKSYLVDKLNGRRMGMETTASSRRQDYTFPPVSRMTNTFIAPGTDTDEQIIGSIEYGLYAKKLAAVRSTRLPANSTSRSMKATSFAMVRFVNRYVVHR